MFWSMVFLVDLVGYHGRLVAGKEVNGALIFPTIFFTMFCWVMFFYVCN